MPDPAPLVVFSDDWGRHPSSCQHLVRQLLPTRPVVWVNTIGTRPPRLDLATLKRAGEKFRQWLRPATTPGVPQEVGRREHPSPLAGERRGWGEGVGGVAGASPGGSTPEPSDSPRGHVRVVPPSPTPPPQGGRGDDPPAPHAPANDTRLSQLAPRVLNPRMWPSFRSRVARGLNRRLLGRALRAAVADLPAPPVVVTTLPITADLVGEFPAARWVYYCVDDFGVWPGLDGRTMQRMEAELVAKADVVVAVSETLQTHLAGLGRASHLLTHGVDLAHFRAAAPPLPALADLADPLVVFWGVIDRRMDIEFVRTLAGSLESGTVLLVGPQDDPDPALFRVPRVVARPPVAYADLPALAARAGVLVMPYADLPVTRAMQPLKLKEYLATGKPVVVRELPATRPWADCLDAAATPAAFAAAVRARLAGGVPAEQAAARTRLDAEGWAAKAAQFARWLGGA